MRSTQVQLPIFSSCVVLTPLAGGAGVIELSLEMEKVSEVKEQSQAHGMCLSVIFPAPFQNGHGVYVCVRARTHMRVCTCAHTHTAQSSNTASYLGVHNGSTSQPNAPAFKQFL